MSFLRTLRKIRLWLKIIGEVFYSKRDGVQESAEKIINCYLVEVIFLFLLTGGCLGIGFGADQNGGWSWQMAGLFWVGPALWFAFLNICFGINYFQVIKRGNKEEMELFFPEKLNKLILINAIFGWFFPYSICAKTIFYKHFMSLYKRDQLPWISQHDTRKERMRKLKQGRREKRRELEIYLKIDTEELQVAQ
ncbi:hypothetical protein WEN_02800 [Mycoplasma wenyonii str. Massachusetts]|uniref:Uncharacterized protein n=1 Tax=Mycoplasma wenyonii (strain Massachusetts) TaxID=1197325 RepID=I6Z6X1_MYCWM|nr:hypothetical protein [Mycoplasma wenyonii]AFN65343.1 hypothetical protein WEN_02800 [Mycoplasma wenyonii str. Massachusetts]